MGFVVQFCRGTALWENVRSDLWGNLCGNLSEGLAVDVDYVVGGGEVLRRAGAHKSLDSLAKCLSFSEYAYGRRACGSGWIWCVTVRFDSPGDSL